MMSTGSSLPDTNEVTAHSGVQFCAIRCYRCGLCQVQRMKRAGKFQCVVCREHQAIDRLLCQGEAKQCRKVVQSLNHASSLDRVKFTPATESPRGDIGPEASDRSPNDEEKYTTRLQYYAKTYPLTKSVDQNDTVTQSRKVHHGALNTSQLKQLGKMKLQVEPMLGISQIESNKRLISQFQLRQRSAIKLAKFLYKD